MTSLPRWKNNVVTPGSGKKLSKSRVLAMIRQQALADLAAAQSNSGRHGDQMAVRREWDQREVAAFNRLHSQVDEITDKLMKRNGGEAVWRNPIDCAMLSGGYALSHPTHGHLCIDSPVHGQSIPVSFPYDVAKRLLQFFPHAEIVSVGLVPHNTSRIPGVSFNKLVDGVRYGYNGKLFDLSTFFEEKGLSGFFNAAYN